MMLVFVLTSLFGHVVAQDFFMGASPQPDNNFPVVEPMINEGSLDCAQFVYSPSSLSAKCLVHKLAIDSGRYDGFSISLTGLETPEFTDTVELTTRINQCQSTVEISCIQNDFCTVTYFKNGFKTTLKTKGLRFLVKGDLVTAEITKYDNQGTQNIQTIYQCRTTVNMYTTEKLRYEVRLYLNRAFAGHNIELSGGDVRRYRNGEQTYTTTEEPSTTYVPFAVTNLQRGPRFPFPPFSISQTTQRPDLTTQPTMNIDKPRIEEFGIGGVNKNAVVTVNGMQKSPDGKSMLLDITIRTQVQVPNSIY